MNASTVTLYRMSMPEHECPWGLRAVKLLTEKGISFRDIKLRTRQEVDEFKAKYGVATTPQIFFDNERVGGYTDLAERLQISAEKTEVSYTPVIAIFSTTSLMALATATGIPGFMGFSLSLLASLKLMDINAFVESFQKYDLITKRFKTYGKAYPFAELLLGLGFLSGIAPLATGIGSLLLGISGATSVFKAVYIDKMELNCACIGGNSKAPLGAISFAENAIMTLMGASLIFSTLTAPSAISNRGNPLSEPVPIQRVK